VATAPGRTRERSRPSGPPGTFPGMPDGSAGSGGGITRIRWAQLVPTIDSTPAPATTALRTKPRRSIGPSPEIGPARGARALGARSRLAG
jgi:hypothetical protein